LAVIKGIQTACTVILAQGDLTVIIIVEAIANAMLMGVSYYKEAE
jgi:hypothetical protein